MVDSLGGFKGLSFPGDDFFASRQPRGPKAKNTFLPVSLLRVLSYVEDPNFEDRERFGVIGFARLSRHSSSVRRPFSHSQVYSAVVLNLQRLRGLQYDENIFAFEDMDFNFRVTSTGLHRGSVIQDRSTRQQLTVDKVDWPAASVTARHKPHDKPRELSLDQIELLSEADVQASQLLELRALGSPEKGTNVDSADEPFHSSRAIQVALTSSEHGDDDERTGFIRRRLSGTAFRVDLKSGNGSVVCDAGDLQFPKPRRGDAMKPPLIVKLNRFCQVKVTLPGWLSTTAKGDVEGNPREPYDSQPQTPTKCHSTAPAPAASSASAIPPIQLSCMSNDTLDLAFSRWLGAAKITDQQMSDIRDEIRRFTNCRDPPGSWVKPVLQVKFSALGYSGVVEESALDHIWRGLFQADA
jgi:hypothetical protein